jgi:serine/threonine protein phosphatase 1
LIAEAAFFQMALGIAAFCPYLSGVFKRLFKSKAEAAKRHYHAPAGERLYAIGDIHGRRDLLEALLKQIDEDDQARGPAKTTLIILGDLMDRGADSRGVIELLMQLETASDNIVFLAGNHEELMIRTWEGERNMASTFNRAGGKETLMSYGVTAETYDSWDLGEMTEQLGRLVPADHIRFLKGFRDWHKAGDYLFVHAGIRPGIDIEDQTSEDLRWIRGGFLDSNDDFGMMVIHGHTITKTVDERSNRIGIDTGAYGSGVLTAIGLEGTERWYLST